RDRLPDRYVALGCSRHRTFDDQQVIVGVHAEHFQVVRRDARAAHAARAAHPLDDARWKRRRADRTRRAMEHRAVRRGAAGEVMALHDALETFAAARADDVHALAVREDRDEYLIAGLRGLTTGGHFHLAAKARRRHVGLFEVSRGRLV